MTTTPTFNVWFGDKVVQFPPKEAAAKPHWATGNACIDHILNGGYFEPLMKIDELPETRSRWRTQLRAAIQTRPSTPEILSDFHTQWHVCHSRLRELVDDDDLLFEFMWAWLPPYTGPDMVLYRGENIDRLQAGKLGSAWSDKEETARRFAQGHNAFDLGGAVLRAVVPASLIIAGPSQHSIGMDESEFSVDTRRLASMANIESIATYPPMFFT
jgi:hypothetical protein